MDFTTIIPMLQQSSLYDLYRFQSIISNELNNPGRIEHIKASITIGQNVEYFEADGNRLIPAIIVEKQLKKVLVENLTDHKRWWIRYFMLNLSGEQLVKPSPTGKLDKHTVSVGDIVGFEHNGNKIIGTVTKLNPKTVNLVTASNQKWNVYYGSLFHVVDTRNVIIDLLPIKN